MHMCMYQNRRCKRNDDGLNERNPIFRSESHVMGAKSIKTRGADKSPIQLRPKHHKP